MLLGRSVRAVRGRRAAKGIPKLGRKWREFWTPEDDRLLGTLPDKEVAERLGRTLNSVTLRRQRLGIPRLRRRKIPVYRWPSRAASPR